MIFTRTADTVTIRNRYHTLSSDHLRFAALTEVDGAAAHHVELTVPSIPPGGSAAVRLPTEVLEASESGETWLTVRAELLADTPWADAGHLVAWQQFDLTPATAHRRPSTGSRRVQPRAELVEAPERVTKFDETTGRLTSLFGMPVDGPRLELWRAPTDNDRSDMRGSYELGAPEDTDGEGSPGPSSESRWRQRGLDRLVHRVADFARDEQELTVRVRTSAANSGLFVDVAYHWVTGDDRLDLRVELVPSRGWDCTWPRIGVRFELPAELLQATWFGTGPGESYPDTRRAARVGRFTAGVDELNVAYSRPQETGHRAELRWLEISDDTGPRLRLDTRRNPSGHRPGFTLTRHTPQELDEARHPYELAESGRTYLFIDDAVHGVGSRACGFDVLPEHALWPGARSFAVTLSQPAS
jgi:beta-galactosidase